MRSHKLTNLLLLLSVGIFLFGSGYKLGEWRRATQSQRLESNVRQKSSDAQNLDFSLFWSIWDQLESKYVDKKKLDPKKMYYGAIKGMVASLDDPYTFFLTPEENKQSKDDLGGRFEGIGAELGTKAGLTIIVAPLKDSPAEKAGLVAGDIILKVNGESIKGWVLPQVVSKIRGEKGTKVKLTIAREEGEVDLEIQRDVIKVESVLLQTEKLTSCKESCQTVAYLKLNQFGENTVDEWQNAVSTIKTQWDKKEIKGLVLDLRNNPGGYLESSVFLAGEFLPKDTLVITQESTVMPSREYKVMRTGKLTDIPLTVLINGGSASASEILSGALRDYKRATLIGEKSFGKGSVQEALDLDSGAGLHITIAKWVLPKGEWINHKGIEPEITVKNTIPENYTMSREFDSQLDKAIERIISP